MTADDRFFPTSPRRIALEATPVALFTLGWVTFLYHLWNVALRVPLYQDRSDARLIANIVQNIIEQGWFEKNPHLGAPYGQVLYEFPHGGETWQLAFIKVMSLFTSDYGLLMNMYYIGGFVVTVVVTFLVMRHLRLRYATAAVASVLYVFLPFHFYHEQSHLFRSSYYYAPIACLVVLWAMQWRERFLIDPGAPSQGTAVATLRWTVRQNLRWRRVAFIVIACVFLAGTETMTTTFTMTLLALTGIIGAIRHREPARLLVSFSMVALLGVTFLALLSPTLLYVHSHGTNDSAARREVVDQERFGLSISRMVLPTNDHRSSAIRSFMWKSVFRKTPVLSEGGQALTTLGAVGLISALFWSLTRGWGRLEDALQPDRRAPFDRRALLDNGALVILLSILTATISGFALILSVIGFSQVRVWNRIVLLIAFFAFVFTAHWFERLYERLQNRRAVPWPALAAVVLLLGVFGLADGGQPDPRNYPAMTADFARDKAFVAQVEAVVKPGTAIFQLPVVAFPEDVPPHLMLDYDQMRPFLQSNGSTSWSYGAVKGRPEADWQWQKVRDRVGPIGSLPGLLGMGFNGIWVDTHGYDDKAVALQGQLSDVLGVQPMVSEKGRYLYFDMRPYRQRLGRTDASLRAEAKKLFGVSPPAGRP